MPEELIIKSVKSRPGNSTHCRLRLQRHVCCKAIVLQGVNVVSFSANFSLTEIRRKYSKQEMTRPSSSFGILVPSNCLVVRLNFGVEM